MFSCIPAMHGRGRMIIDTPPHRGGGGASIVFGTVTTEEAFFFRWTTPVPRVTNNCTADTGLDRECLCVRKQSIYYQLT